MEKEAGIGVVHTSCASRNIGKTKMGRGKHTDLTGTENGLFRCLGREGESKPIKWRVQCKNCQANRLIRSSEWNSRQLRCLKCEGSPNNLPEPEVVDWKQKFEEEKDSIRKALRDGDDASLIAAAFRLIYASKKTKK